MSDNELKSVTDLLAGTDARKVYVNGPQQVYVEKAESFEKAALSFSGVEEVEALVRSAAKGAGREVGGKEPVMHFRLEGGTTVAVFRPQGAESPLICFSK